MSVGNTAKIAFAVMLAAGCGRKGAYPTGEMVPEGNRMVQRVPQMGESPQKWPEGYAPVKPRTVENQLVSEYPVSSTVDMKKMSALPHVFIIAEDENGNERFDQGDTIILKAVRNPWHDETTRTFGRKHPKYNEVFQDVTRVLDDYRCKRKTWAGGKWIKRY